MVKYYFGKDDESCYTINWHYDYMRENGLKEMEVFEAVIEYGNGYYFCTEVGECGIVGESCGKQCSDYEPRNGKNGICKSYRNTYKYGKSIILKLNE